MCRASYYVEACATLPLAEAALYGFKEHEIVATTTRAFGEIALSDKSYAQTMAAKKKAAFDRLPEAEKERRQAYARAKNAEGERFRKSRGLQAKGAHAKSLSESQKGVLARVRAPRKAQR